MKHIFKILRSTKSLWRYYAAISVLTILLSLMNLLQPLLSGWAIDEIRKGHDARMTYIAILVSIILLTDVLANIFSNVGGYLGDQMSIKLNKILSKRYYEHLLSLPQRYFDTELSGKIINRLNRSIVQITNFMQMLSNNFLQFIFSTVFALVIVSIYSWQVALMLFSLYPIYIWMTFRSSGKWRSYQTQKNLHTDIASGRFAESINQVKVVKSYIQEKRELKFFDRQIEKVVKINRPQSKFWHIRDVQRRILLSLIFFAVYMFIFMKGASGVYTPGQVVALILYAMQIRIPLSTISFLVENTQRAMSDSKDYFEIMDIRPDIADALGARSLDVPEGLIEFDDVSFSYDAKQPVLQDIAVTIMPGTRVALVGESGEGKTTLTNLLLRLYEPEKGQIRIDGQDINSVSQRSLRQNIGVVFQDSSLFSGSIRENIGYSASGATERQILHAAKAANADEFITKFDEGYNTQIGERGLKLSGGQKQRIAIARALLKNAPILILDEATSSLDSKSEALVQDALDHLVKGRTTIIIAHRLSTIQNVDQIITIRGGRIDEVGTPAKLAKSGGIYDQLLKLQRGRNKEQTQKELKNYDISA
ncbi:MAG: ABC transporter ATP-binding protein [Candidatus Saccharimonadales bacterium]